MTWRSLLGLLLLPRLAVASTWIVDPGVASGVGDETAPFGSVAEALARARPGDLIICRPGAYGALRFAGVQATVANPIVVQFEPGAALTLLRIEASQGLRLDGVALTAPRADATGSGVVIDGSLGITLVRIAAHNHAMELAHSRDIVVEQARLDGPRAAVRIAASQWIALRGNAVLGAGVDVRSTDNLLMDGNTITGEQAGFLVEAAVGRSTWRNNVIVNSAGGAVRVQGMVQGRTKAGRATTPELMIEHNTLVGRDQATLAVDDGVALRMFANVIAQTGEGDTVHSLATTQVESDVNVFVPGRLRLGSHALELAAWQRTLGVDADSHEGRLDEVFANVTTGDFRPKSAGPLIDRVKAPRAVWRDVVGHLRPLGRGPDVGAFEYCVGAACRAAAPWTGLVRQAPRPPPHSAKVQRVRVPAGCMGGPLDVVVAPLGWVVVAGRRRGRRQRRQRFTTAAK